MDARPLIVEENWQTIRDQLYSEVKRKEEMYLSVHRSVTYEPFAKLLAKPTRKDRLNSKERRQKREKERGHHHWECLFRLSNRTDIDIFVRMFVHTRLIDLNHLLPLVVIRNSRIVVSIDAFILNLKKKNNVSYERNERNILRTQLDDQTIFNLWHFSQF